MDFCLTLSEQETQIVLEALGEGRARVVMPVIQKIIDQATAQARAAGDPPAPPAPLPPEPNWR